MKSILIRPEVQKIVYGGEKPPCDDNADK